ncbi:hypothetical protein [Psychrobacillus lasiicapitis]|uniref:hypothetical protein n=1 Tax=Psychrobacillus lasiicapitis TaxID=1636719 RepID=UPI0014772842|nr:hypothetical protein [Psychrobacillus lasiicapitis]GGA31756.1 hypothetical protein GCM10011384_21630 [Psychrobacillus lasiicapitis]
MDKYSIVKPLLQNGIVLTSGEVELNTDEAKRLVELEVIQKIEKGSKRSTGQKQEGDK